MTYCLGCGWLMVGHVHLPIVRCINERCHEFDRWAAVNEKLADRVAPEKTDASPSCRWPITDANGLDDA